MSDSGLVTLTHRNGKFRPAGAGTQKSPQGSAAIVCCRFRLHTADEASAQQKCSLLGTAEDGQEAAQKELLMPHSPCRSIEKVCGKEEG